MDFNFNETQDILKKTAKEFMSRYYSGAMVRELEKDVTGFREDIWKEMARLGWLGWIIPEEYNGVGGDFLDIVVLFEEMGRSCFILPFFQTVALCSLPVMEYGSAEQKKDILSKIAEGECVWTLAITETSASYEASGIQLSASLKEDDYVLTGAKLFVPYANVADNLLVVARTGSDEPSEDGITVFIVDARSPGITTEVIPTVAHDKQCEVRFDNVRVPERNILGEAGKGWDIVEFILQRASILKCAEMLGGSQTALDMANDYAKERVQFGKPIGSFQAIQHKLANMLIDVEGLRRLVYEAAWHTSADSPSRLLASMAKAKANEVSRKTCLEAIKVHGAIGFTEELDLGLYFRRTWASGCALGDTNFHRERIAAELERHEPLFSIRS